MATPLSKDGTLDRQRLRELVDRLIEGGVDGLLPLGTSGEFALLSDEDRKIVIEDVVDQTNGRIPVVSGISDTSVEKVLQFAKQASDAGADALIATPVYYYSTNDEGNYNFFRVVSESSDLPLMIYNIPEWTHNFVTPEVVGRLAEEKLVVGMKYTQYNFLNLLKFLHVAKDKISIFTGSDGLAYSNLEFGGAGAVIGVSNVVPELSSRIFEEFKCGNFEEARRAQMKLLPVMEAIAIGEFPAGLKEAMSYAGFKVGNVKPPLSPLSNEQSQRVKNLIEGASLK